MIYSLSLSPSLLDKCLEVDMAVQLKKKKSMNSDLNFILCKRHERAISQDITLHEQSVVDGREW